MRGYKTDNRTAADIRGPSNAMTMLMPMPIPMLIFCHARQAESQVRTYLFFKEREKAKIYKPLVCPNLNCCRCCLMHVLSCSKFPTCPITSFNLNKMHRLSTCYEV